MINIVSGSGIPIVYQVRQSWAQPTFTGAVQWNGSSKQLEVSTGTSWIKLENNVQLDTSPHVITALKWIEKKMAEEEEIQLLAATDPTIADLLKTIDKTKEQIEMVRILKKPEVSAI